MAAPGGSEPPPGSGDRRGERSTSPGRGRSTGHPPAAGGRPAAWPTPPARPGRSPGKPGSAVPVTPAAAVRRPEAYDIAVGDASPAVAYSPAGELEVGMLFSPTYDPRDPLRGAELGPRLARFNERVAASINALADSCERLMVRQIALETAHRSLADGAKDAVQEILRGARAEFESHSAGVAILRQDVAEEVLALRSYVADTREGLGRLHAASSDQFDTVKDYFV